MKRAIGILLLLALTVMSVSAAPSEKPAPPNKALEMAKAVTTITGVAISPLLGTGAVGAWEWMHAKTPEQKARLPWYAHLSFWLPALLLVGAVAVKDAAGTAVPPGLKKPLDVAETIENKVSGLVAAGAVVPMLGAVFSFSTGTDVQAIGTTPVCLAGIAGFNFAGLLNLLTVPFAVVAFGLVWLLSNTINVLILLSPWGVVDATLKSVRTALLGTLVLIHNINPVWGAILSLTVIVIAYFLAGWSFRLLVCGSIFVWDFVTGRKRRFTPAANANWMFTARPIKKTPTRTYGKLVRTETGQLRFDYRPWLFGKPTSVELPAGTYAVGRGLFYSEILLVEGEAERMLLVLPPRYRTHEDELLPLYRFTEVRPTGLRRTWQWIKSLFGFPPRPSAVPA